MNAWLNHVRQFRKQNRHLSYKQLLSQAKKSYNGGGDGPATSPPTGAMNSLLNAIKGTKGGGVTGFESRSSLTRSASTVGGRRSRSRSHKTRRRRR